MDALRAKCIGTSEQTSHFCCNITCHTALSNINCTFDSPQDLHQFIGTHIGHRVAERHLTFDQIEKFQCLGLELTTAKDLSPGIFRSHVARVICPQMCLEDSQLH